MRTHKLQKGTFSYKIILNKLILLCAVWTYVRMYIHTYILHIKHDFVQNKYVHTYVCMHLCTCMYMYVHVRADVYNMYVCSMHIKNQ